MTQSEHDTRAERAYEQIRDLSLRGWSVAILAGERYARPILIAARKLGREPIEIAGGSVAEIADVVLSAAAASDALAEAADAVVLH